MVCTLFFPERCTLDGDNRFYDATSSKQVHSGGQLRADLDLFDAPLGRLSAVRQYLFHGCGTECINKQTLA